MSDRVAFSLNGQSVEIDTDPTRRLIDVLREDFGLIGVKEACGEGECGACSILLDGRLAPACVIALGAVEGREVVTIEGFAQTERFKVLSESFAEAGAVQCGYCTPGMILAAEALLSRDPSPDREAIRRALSGNLCRCTGYELIIQAIDLAAEEGRALWA